MSVTITGTTYLADWPYASDTAFDVKAQSDKAWVTDDLVVVPANEPHKVGTGTITALRPTLPNITLPATSAGLDNQTAKWTVTLHRTGRKQVVSTVLADFSLPVSFEPTVTWAQVKINKSGKQPLRDTSVYTKTETNHQIALAMGDSNYAGVGVLGRIETATTPADPLHPKAVLDDDPRLGGGGGLNVINVTDDPYNADKTGATNTTTAINSAITAAALTSKRVYLPTGTYLINPASFAGTLFALNSTGMEIFGDGQGKTILQFPDSITAANDFDLFNISAAFCSIHDLSIRGASTVTGNFSIKMINIAGGYYADIYRNEIYNLNSNNSQTAGAVGIHLYGLAYNEVSTTLGTTIVSGSQVVTPASMDKIYKGRVLTIGGTTEVVTVTAITATTFTATFANAHNGADAVTAPWQQQLYAHVHDNYIHDSLIATAIIVNGSANTLRNNTIIRVGNTSGRHGLYVQAGNNLIEGHWVEGVGGYSFHQYLGTSTTDASQNKYIGNTSLNPGTLHMIASTDNSDGTNPLVANGVSLDRSVLVTGNVFRSDKGAFSVDLNITNALAANNIFENATLKIGADSLAQGNVLRITDAALTDTSVGIQAAGARSIVQGNRFLNWPGSTVIRLDGANSQAIGNTIQGATGSGGFMFSVPAGSIIRDNYASTDTGRIFTDLQATDITIENNNFSTGATYAFALFNTATGVIRNNKFSTGAIEVNGINKDLYFDTNIIPLAAGGQGMTFGRENGRALFIQNANPTVTANFAGFLLKLDASGELDIAKTTDMRFIGVSTRLYSNATPVTTGNLVVGQPGTVAIVAADAAWTVGNVGIVSVAADGKIHDTASQTPPAAPASYGVFLDSGGAAGNARVLIVKTL